MDQVKPAGLRILSSGRTPMVPVSLAVDLVIQVCTRDIHRHDLHDAPVHLCAPCLAPAEVRVLSVILGCTSLFLLQLVAAEDKSCPAHAAGSM